VAAAKSLTRRSPLASSSISDNRLGSLRLWNSTERASVACLMTHNDIDICPRRQEFVLNSPWVPGQRPEGQLAAAAILAATVQLYVCWGTFSRDGRHPCGNAHEALTDAGHEPKVVRTHGCFRTDPLFSGRREVKQLTGNYKVPTLVLDDGTLVDGSANIIAWAKANSRSRAETN
jgi:hypothetical protein